MIARVEFLLVRVVSKIFGLFGCMVSFLFRGAAILLRNSLSYIVISRALTFRSYKTSLEAFGNWLTRIVSET